MGERQRELNIVLMGSSPGIAPAPWLPTSKHHARRGDPIQQLAHPDLDHEACAVRSSVPPFAHPTHASPGAATVLFGPSGAWRGAPELVGCELQEPQLARTLDKHVHRSERVGLDEVDGLGAGRRPTIENGELRPDLLSANYTLEAI